MSSKVDKGWMKCVRNSHGYIQGVRSFIDFAKNNGGGNTLFSCPCRRCMNGKGLIPLSEISYHLLKNGFYSRYTTWRYHGESSVEVAQSTHENVTERVDENIREGVDENVDENVGTSRCCKKNKLADVSEIEPLYSSCPKGKTQLYAAIKLNNIKTQYGFSDNGVTAEEEAANHEEEVSSEDVWLKAHTQAGGAILASAMPFDDLLKKTQEAIKEKQDAGLSVKDPCALTVAFGSNSRGRVHSLGLISRLQVEHYAPTHAMVKELKAKEGGLSQRLEEIGGRVELLIENVGTLCNAVKYIQASRGPSVVGSNVDVSSGSQDVVGSTQLGSHAQTNSPVGPLVSPAQSRIVGMHRCSLLNMDGEIIAISRLRTGVLGRTCHSLVVPPTHAKVVLLDEILMPLQVTAKANMLASHFRDIGVGGYVLHPKMCITND